MNSVSLEVSDSSEFGDISTTAPTTTARGGGGGGAGTSSSSPSSISVSSSVEGGGREPSVDVGSVASFSKTTSTEDPILCKMLEFLDCVQLSDVKIGFDITSAEIDVGKLPTYKEQFERHLDKRKLEELVARRMCVNADGSTCHPLGVEPDKCRLCAWHSHACLHSSGIIDDGARLSIEPLEPQVQLQIAIRERSENEINENIEAFLNDTIRIPVDAENHKRMLRVALRKCKDCVIYDPYRHFFLRKFQYKEIFYLDEEKLDSWHEKQLDYEGKTSYSIKESDPQDACYSKNDPALSYRRDNERKALLKDAVDEEQSNVIKKSKPYKDIDTKVYEKRGKEVLEDFYLQHFGDFYHESEYDDLQKHLDFLIRKPQRMLSRDCCLHLCIEKWKEDYKCIQCFCSLKDVDPDRNEREREIEEVTNRSVEKKPEDGDEEAKNKFESHLGKLSCARGVPIGWLVEFTKANKCWNMTTQEVCRRFVFPATAASRCRYVELEHMKGIIGNASTFISHCRAAVWGDLVAAACNGDVADRNRRVWIDIFACRQWPSSLPDLNFAETIDYCSSLLMVCPSLKELGYETYYESPYDYLQRQKKSIDKSIRKIMTRDECFEFGDTLVPKVTTSRSPPHRVWCLIEANTAALKRKPVIIMGGSRDSSQDTYGEDSSVGFKFAHDKAMLYMMSKCIDVETTEATIKSDKDTLIEYVTCKGKEPEGMRALNKRLKCLSATASELTEEYPDPDAYDACDEDSENYKYGELIDRMDRINKYVGIVQSAVMGDEISIEILSRDILETESPSPSSPSSSDLKYGYLHVVFAGGYYEFLKDKIPLLKDVNILQNHINKSCAEYRTSPLGLACKIGDAATLPSLFSNGATINCIEITMPCGLSELMIACQQRQDKVCEILIQRVKDVSGEDKEELLRRYINFRTKSGLSALQIVLLRVKLIDGEEMIEKEIFPDATRAIADLLIRNGANYSDELDDLIKWGILDSQSTIEMPVFTNASFSNNESPKSGGGGGRSSSFDSSSSLATPVASPSSSSSPTIAISTSSASLSRQQPSYSSSSSSRTLDEMRLVSKHKLPSPSSVQTQP